MRFKKKEKEETKLVVIITKIKEPNGGFTTNHEWIGDLDLLIDMKTNLLQIMIEEMKEGMK